MLDTHSHTYGQMHNDSHTSHTHSKLQLSKGRNLYHPPIQSYAQISDWNKSPPNSLKMYPDQHSHGSMLVHSLTYMLVKCHLKDT